MAYIIFSGKKKKSKLEIKGSPSSGQIGKSFRKVYVYDDFN